MVRTAHWGIACSPPNFGRERCACMLSVLHSVRARLLGSNNSREKLKSALCTIRMAYWGIACYPLDFGGERCTCITSELLSVCTRSLGGLQQGSTVCLRMQCLAVVTLKNPGCRQASRSVSVNPHPQSLCPAGYRPVCWFCR